MSYDLKFLKQIFDFYINSSLHVSLATSSLVLLTYYFAKIPADLTVLFFVFFGTLTSYNVIKYGVFVTVKQSLKKSMKVVLLLTFFSAFTSFFLFFKLQLSGQITAVFFAFLSVLYLVPVSKRRSNLRNLAGVKIYIVSFCWAGVTLLIPLLNANIPIEFDVFFKFLQRFVLTLILILIFEINDLKYDDLRLKTVPQTIGVKKTKVVVYLLLLLFYILEFFKANQFPNQWIVNLILVFTTSMFCFFASERKSKYYTLFWVESIPIFWYLLILLL